MASRQRDGRGSFATTNNLLGQQMLSHVRPTVFLENFFFLDWAAESIARDGTIRLPFGAGRTSPVAVQDVAEVIAVILTNPAASVGKVYELRGAKV
jgi:NAD(P)H dehydrogenase (quinone)